MKLTGVDELENVPGLYLRKHGGLVRGNHSHFAPAYRTTSHSDPLRSNTHLFLNVEADLCFGFFGHDRV
jgi:hypothetical protein